ncbi:hypothetical protein M378DRAFT_39320, partial [Amanita muscaria Koide BX008]
LQLPNGQVARSAWKEKSLRRPRISRNVKVNAIYDISFGEVQYYFQEVINGQKKTLALISVYSQPDEQLIHQSHGTLLVCKYRPDSLLVIDVKFIRSVVAMIPFPAM